MSQTTNLNMIPQRNVRNLYFSQNDVGRVATVNLVDGGTPYSIPIGATVKIQATKPSGLGFSETCTFSGSTVTVTSTATMTDEAGIFPCEIQVTNSGVILGSANFNFFVERNPHPNGTTDGTAESILNDITVAYNHAMDQIENAGGLTVAIKNALLNCFQKVAWIDEHGQDYYDALADELFAVTGITLNSSTLLFSSLGSTQQLTASLIPSTSTATVSWASSDTSVATVSSSGLVTSVANGSATITASVGSVSATCSVTVSVATVTSISAVLNAGGHTFYVGDPVDDIKPYLTVTATYSDTTTQTVPSGSYTLSGTLSQVGANTITVSYESVTTTVSVTCAAAELVSISAVYTQSGTVYTTDTLDSLKSDLVVTAHYSDTTTSTVASADYTLSGTLTVGTSTITVTYEGKTDTFSVTVSDSSVSIATTPYTFGSPTPSQASWNQSSQTLTLTANGTSNWPGAMLQNLLYQYQDVINKTFRIRATATVTGYSSGGSGVVIAPALYTSANPVNNGTNRKASQTMKSIAENGTFSIDETMAVSDMFSGTGLDAYYLGLGVMINTNSGCTASITDFNITVSG